MLAPSTYIRASGKMVPGFWAHFVAFCRFLACFGQYWKKKVKNFCLSVWEFKNSAYLCIRVEEITRMLNRGRETGPQNHKRYGL